VGVKSESTGKGGKEERRKAQKTCGGELLPAAVFAGSRWRPKKSNKSKSSGGETKTFPKDRQRDLWSFYS